MGTDTYTIHYGSGESTTSSTKSSAWTFIGTLVPNYYFRDGIPKYATIQSAVCSIALKRDGTSDLKMYNHDAAWVIVDSNKTIIETLSKQSQAIARSYKTFTRDCTSYIQSGNSNAGLATTIAGLGLYASGDLSKKYTYKDVKTEFKFTYPTITVSATANKDNYGEVVSTTHTLGSPIDIGCIGTWGTQYCTIEARPKTGYRFVGWDDGVTDSTRNVELSEDVLNSSNTTFNYRAIFEPITYDITVSAQPPEGGTVFKDWQGDYGTAAPLMATPNDGYKFVKWSDGVETASRDIIITGDAHYTAIFERIMFAVATDTLCDDGTAGGTVVGGGTYASGSSVTLTATPKEGYEFVQWSDGSTDAVKVFTATADSIFTAEFRVLKFTIITQVTPDGAGTVLGGGTYNWGTMVNLKVAIKSGYRFVRWSDGGTSTNRTVRVTEDATYTAIFEPEKNNQIYIGTSLVKSIYYSAATNTITFVVDEISTGIDVVGTVDGYHLAFSNTAPTDAIEVAGVYVGTKQVHSS